MKRVSKIIFASLLSLITCGEAMAAFTLDHSRYIYEEGKKNISVNITNKTDKVFGGQVWIDNVDTRDGVYMIATPSFFKIEGGEKQIIRISRVDTPLPTDRESLFLINTQEIPPAPEKTEGASVSVAINTRLKLIWRPSSLVKGREGAEKRVQYGERDGKTWVYNPTPYYFAITEIKADGKRVPLDDAVQSSVSRFSPFSKVSLGKKLSGKISIAAVNDNGGVDDFQLSPVVKF